ncbi:Cell death protease [Apophysomyces ossiformis]|uniref:Pheromone-processing carboxypeptidase KEX1 n=1 Tax=Apophysomyces ossiformis TaxID=679940 RepID=A0A8H7BZA4_9FUNG|nr:Cell death protease [Apophysomyces ossiformis]
MDGLFLENGPYRVNKDLSLTISEGGWQDYAVTVFVDQPVGTGFSYSDANGYMHSLEEISSEFTVFLDKFFDLFPHLRKYDLYLAGESFAGTYIPYFASELLKANEKQGTKYNLQGIAIGNGWISPVHQYDAYYDFSVKNNLLEGEWKEIASRQLKECHIAMKEKVRINVRVCENVLQTVLDNSTHTKDGQPYCINQYDIRLKDEESPDCGQSWPYELKDMTEYLRLPALKSAIHANTQALGWIECSHSVSRALHSDNSNFNPIENTREMDANNMVSGEYDLICNTLGTEYLIGNLTWNGDKGFQSAEQSNWFIDDKLVGYYTTARNLTYVLIKNGSHMVPYDRPIETLDMINRFMGVGDNVVRGLPSRVDQNLTAVEPTKSSSGSKSAGTSTPAGEKIVHDDTESDSVSAAQEEQQDSNSRWGGYKGWSAFAVAIMILLLAAVGFCWYRSGKSSKSPSTWFERLRQLFGKTTRPKKLRLDDQDDTNELDELVVQTPTLFAAEDSDDDAEPTKRKTTHFAIVDDDEETDDIDDFAEWHEETNSHKEH